MDACGGGFALKADELGFISQFQRQFELGGAVLGGGGFGQNAAIAGGGDDAEIGRGVGRKFRLKSTFGQFHITQDGRCLGRIQNGKPGAGIVELAQLFGKGGSRAVIQAIRQPDDVERFILGEALGKRISQCQARRVQRLGL